MASNLFKGKESRKEEGAEKRAVKAGKMSPAMYAKGEAKEGGKAAKGKLPPFMKRK